MKNNFLLALALLLFAFATSKANSNYKDRDDKVYFSSFRKNEEPKNKKFNILNENSEITMTQCVTNCHRTNGCYDKPTSTGVLLCSLECGITCA